MTLPKGASTKSFHVISTTNNKRFSLWWLDRASFYARNLDSALQCQGLAQVQPGYVHRLSTRWFRNNIGPGTAYTTGTHRNGIVAS